MTQRKRSEIHALQFGVRLSTLVAPITEQMNNN
jgi:hypothetical protein